MRETFILHFKEELSYKEIAEKLNISYDNTRKRISQARAILKQRYNQDFLGEDHRYSTDLDEYKPQTSSQSPKMSKSQNTIQVETSINQTLVLADQLQTGQIIDRKEPEQGMIIAQLVLVDVQSDSEVEKVGKKSDVNEECLLRKFGYLWKCGNFQKVLQLSHAQIACEKRLINEKIKNLLLVFNMMSFRHFALVSSIAVISAVTFTPKTQAQNANVDFAGTISPILTINGSGNGNNPSHVDFVSNSLIRLSSNLNLTSNTSLIFTITSIADNGTILSGSKTYNNLDFVGAEIKDGNNLSCRAFNLHSWGGQDAHPTRDLFF